MFIVQLLTSNLTQSGRDDEGILGFMPDKIEAEAKRTFRLVSMRVHSIPFELFRIRRIIFSVLAVLCVLR